MSAEDDLFDTGPSIPRDHYGRVLIAPVDGGKPIGFTRTTTISEQLGDTRALETWKERQVARGVARRPDLIEAARQLTDSKADRKPLNRIATEAHKEVGSNDKADRGTLLHAITEAKDAGLDATFDPKWKQHVATYLRMTEGWEHLHREQGVIHDSLMIHGTPDHISVLPKAMYGRKKQRPRICDLKTGSTLDYGIREIAAQLAIYANAEWMYDWETETRLPMPDDLDKTTGMILHIPQDGGGRGRLYEVDLVAGWEAAQHCIWTHKWRKKKVANLATAVDYADPLEEWLRGRILTLTTYDQARPHLHLLGQEHFGSLSTGINVEAADEIIAVLDQIETLCQVPFPERDPRVKIKPKKR